MRQEGRAGLPVEAVDKISDQTSFFDHAGTIGHTTGPRNVHTNETQFLVKFTRKLRILYSKLEVNDTV